MVSIHCEFHEVANIFPLMSGPNYLDLVSDIKFNGLLEPIWLYEGKIIDGRNRYRACLDAGIEPRFREWEGDGSLVAFVVSLNLHRRHLTESERSMLGARIKPLFETEAKEREFSGKTVNPAANLQQGRSAELAAETVNVSARSVYNADKVLREGAPELIEAVDNCKVSVSTAAVIAEAPKEEQKEIVAKGEKEILRAAKDIRARKAEEKRSERIQKLVEITSGNLPLESGIGIFPVIYCDVPWEYEFCSDPADQIENHYPTMSLEEICALPVAEISADDAILFFWATSPKLAEAVRVISAWGFNYRTCAVWDKEWISMGYYFRQQHEILLVATKGQIPAPRPENRPPSVLRTRRAEHSAKPEEVYQIIEKMYPELPKIELFSRGSREGWTMWGNQAGNGSTQLSGVAEEIRGVE